MKYHDFKQRVKGLPVFSSTLVSSLTDQAETLKVQLTGWKKKGWIIGLRKGLYALSRDDRRIEPPHFFLANQILIPSYVSLESALAYYGLIPEFVAATTSVTARKTCEFKNAFGAFTYQHVQPKGYTGFAAMRETEKISYLVATPEKAVVDFLYLNLSRFKTKDKHIFRESYRFQNCEKLKTVKLANYAACFQTKKLLDITGLFIKEMIP